jgi:ATP-dependent DNA helicase RecQ
MQQRRMIDGSAGADAFKRTSIRKLDALVGLCETAGCRRVRLLEYFGEVSQGNCGNCDNCLSPPRIWNGTVVAQKALSCVYRTGQRFGAGHVIDVLLGRTNERITRLGHTSLSVFGVGLELNDRQWRTVIRQLVALGHLHPDSEAFGALKLTATSRGVLKGVTEVMLREEKPGQTGKSKINGKATKRTNSEPIEPSQTTSLLAVLRAWRSGVARKDGVPAYVVLHDATLEGIVDALPKTHSQLRTVSGIGDRKLKRYGDVLLELVRSSDG